MELTAHQRALLSRALRITDVLATEGDCDRDRMRLRLHPGDWPFLFPAPHVCGVWIVWDELVPRGACWIEAHP